MDFKDRQHELAQTPLSDASKIPRAVISELYEASQVSKVASSKLPDYEFKEKTSITSGELLAYTKAVAFECCMLTFGEEKTRLSKLVSKLHRILLSILPTYAQRCQLILGEIPKLTDAAEAAHKLCAPTSQVLCHWQDFAGKPSSMFYILGPFDRVATKDRFKAEDPSADLTPEQREQQGAEKLEDGLVHFGKVEADSMALSQLYQDTRDLIS